MTTQLDASDPLDALLIDTLSNTPAKGVKKRPAAVSSRFDSRRYADGAENWTRTKGVCLVHEDTHTLLGNFSEYLHRREVGTKKLVRELEPIQIDSVEYVRGPQWVPSDRIEQELMRATESFPALIDIVLPELGLRAPTVEVRVELLWGGINRVELSAVTEFHSSDLMKAVWLPKGIDVLGGMSLDSKLALRAELGLDEREENESQLGS